MKKQPLISRVRHFVDTENEFGWTAHLTDKEVTFLYNIVSQSNANPRYQPTPGQAEWAIRILDKIGVPVVV